MSRLRRAFAGLALGAALCLRLPGGPGDGPVAAAHAGVALDEVVTCRSVERRLPVGRTDLFPLSDGEAVIWMLLKNPDAASVVRLQWYHAGRKVKRTELKVAPSPGYRTWARRKLEPGDGGNWRVDVESAQGVVLGRVHFRVLEGAASLSAEDVEARMLARGAVEAEAQARAQAANRLADGAESDADARAAERVPATEIPAPAPGPKRAPATEIPAPAPAPSAVDRVPATEIPAPAPAPSTADERAERRAAEAAALALAAQAAAAAGAQLELDEAESGGYADDATDPDAESDEDADPRDEAALEPVPAREPGEGAVFAAEAEAPPEDEAEPAPEGAPATIWDPDPETSEAVDEAEPIDEVGLEDEGALRAQTHGPEATTRRGCRALVNLRHADDTYAVLDVRPGVGHHHLEPAPGLAVVGPTGESFALRVVVHADQPVGPHGVVDRRWDALWGLALPRGAPSLWAGVPAQVPAPSEPTPRPFHEHNRLRVLSVLGPLVSLDLSLRGYAGEGEGFDHSRYLTVRPPGRAADVAALIGPRLAALAGMRARNLRPDALPDAPRPEQHDYRQVALLASAGGGLRALTRMACCTFAENGGRLVVDVELGPGPESLAPHLPDAQGHFVDSQACGAIWLDADGRLMARAGRGSARPLAVAGPSIAEVLGVTFIDADHPYAASAQRTAFGVLGQAAGAR